MSEPPKLNKFGPLGAFDPTLFAQAIQGLGLTFRWSRAVECPCRMENSDQWKPDCELCGGDGWWYINPEHDRDRHLVEDYIEVQCTFAQTTIRDSLYEDFGGFSFTDALMTMQSEMPVSFRDRFIGITQEMTWTELIKSSGPGSIVVIGKTTRTTEVQKKSMRYEPTKIHFVASMQDDCTPIYYYEGFDYTILEATSGWPAAGEPARLQWIEGKGPALDQLFTIHYSCRPVWIVDDATYGIQALKGPKSGAKGIFAPRNLPTTFKVKLDFLTRARGS